MALHVVSLTTAMIAAMIDALESVSCFRSFWPQCLMHMAFELEFVWDESSLVQEHFFPSDPFWAVLKTIIDLCDAVAAACFAVCFVACSSFLASSLPVQFFSLLFVSLRI